MIKPLAIARNHEGDLLELRVCPTLIPIRHDLAAVNHQKNAVSIYHPERDEPETMVGMGAGDMPTARSVVRDIVTVVKTSPESRQHIYTSFMGIPHDVSANSMLFESYSYLRVVAADEPNVLGKVATILGDYRINVEEVGQVRAYKTDGTIPILMMLGSATDENVDKAVHEIQRLPEVKEVVRIRRKV